MITEESEYKGSPTLSIKTDAEDKHPFVFGLKKAEKILSSIDEIKEFMNNNKKETK